MRPARDISDAAATIAAMQARIDDLEAIVEELTAPPSDWQDMPGRLGINLSPCESALLAVLLRASPRVVPRAHLLGAMAAAPGAQEGSDPKVVDVVVCRLRRKLGRAREGVRIITVWGVGYRVEVGPKP